jgi:acyl transferase domain-containing protein
MRRNVVDMKHGLAGDRLSRDDDIMFLFTGQGSQYAGMGKDLYNENEDFRKAMDLCDEIYKTLADGESLLNTIFNTESKEGITLHAQPALVALEWSLASMWQANGVAPSVVLGHSVGEIAAACVAGAMSIETALKLAVLRSRLVHKLPSNDGTMTAVRCSMGDANAAMASLSNEEQDLVGVASVNGPNSIVISGVQEVVDKVVNLLGKEGVHLQVSHAFHSPLMRGMEADFRSVVESLQIQQPLVVPLSSTVAGRIIQTGETIEAEHWVKQMTSPVLFEQAFNNVMEHRDDEGDRQHPGVIVEVGPKPVLTKLA